VSITVRCICGQQDDFTAFATSTNGVWKCPACGTVKDTRENYTDENFLAVMAERAGIREAAEC